MNTTKMAYLLMELQGFRLKVNSLSCNPDIGFPGDFREIREHLAKAALILSNVIIETPEMPLISKK